MTIKPDLAIARLFAAVIYADGYLSEQELEYLENTLKLKYNISAGDFQQFSRCTYTQAIHILQSSQGKKYLEECQQSLQSLVTDMEKLASCDKQITPKESLICLCTRLAFESDICSIIAYSEDNFRFSKSDIIYVEQFTDKSVNDDICAQYDNIRYILHNFGYNFIYIPKVQEEFLHFSDSYRKHLLHFLFPENKDQEALDEMILSRLPSAATDSFSNVIFSDAQFDSAFPPSLLIKLPTKHAFSPNNHCDFAMLKIQGSIMQTIQSFFQKYNALAGRNFLQIQNGNMSSMFLYRGFHKTFIEYLRNVVTDIQIHIQKNTVIRYGSLGDIQLPPRLLAAFLTILYYSIKQKPFCKDWGRIDEQYALFEKIYSAFTPSHIYSKNDLYTNIQIDYGKIVSNYFGELQNKCLQKMAPQYNRIDQALYFDNLPVVLVIQYSKVGKVPKSMPFEEWVESL